MSGPRDSQHDHCDRRLVEQAQDQRSTLSRLASGCTRLQASDPGQPATGLESVDETGYDATKSSDASYRLRVTLSTTIDVKSRPASQIPVELASDRKIRDRNKLHYRLSHLPIWIWVFFLAPGPLTVDLFESGFDQRMALWLGSVLVATGIAGFRGRLPGVEPRPYIIRFTEDKPNPLYRRVCYTFAWSAVLTFALLNIAGLIVALVTGEWYLRQLYDVGYFPLAVTIWVLGAFGVLPRVKPSTKGEGHERRYFYGSVCSFRKSETV